jgi:hypothetical protein
LEDKEDVNTEPGEDLNERQNEDGVDEGGLDDFPDD